METTFRFGRLIRTVALALIGGWILTACGGGSRPATPSIEPTVTSSDGVLSWHGLPDPSVAQTSLGLYFAWVTSPLGRSPVREELARIDHATGKVAVQRALEGFFLSALAYDNSLFVTTRSAAREPVVVLRLNPQTLRETGRSQLPDGGYDLTGGGSMAVAGGNLWVAAGDRLDRLSFTRGAATAVSMALPGADSSDVTMNSAGSVLVVGEANQGGMGHIERRDPVTGDLLGVSAVIGGTVDPSVNGVVGNDLWVSESTGNMGFTELYDLTTLTPVGPLCNEGFGNPTCIVGTNGIAAQLTDGLLWVTQSAGGPTRNFCGDPGGQVLASLPIPDGDFVLTIGRLNLFVATPQLSADKGRTFSEEPIPSSCLS